MASHRNEIRVVGADDANMRRLRTLDRYQGYTFVPLLRHEELHGRLPRPLSVITQEALVELRTRPPAAVIAYWDFPANPLARYLSRRLGLGGTSLESVLACSHKYWARTRQARVSPDCVPAFAPLDPFAEDPFSGLELEPPFWIKPIKATGSALSFFVRSHEEAADALQTIRGDIGAFAEPFNYFLSHADVPAWVRAVDGFHLIVEKTLTGRQCTVSGYVHNDEITIIGVVDSLSFPGTSAFSSFRYPSRLPGDVQDRLRDTARTLIRPFGLQESGFNIEFFTNEADGSISVLEVNPRFSQSHASLYSRVDGTSNHQLLLDLALGNEPLFRTGAGRSHVAAKFFYRVFSDVDVIRVPDRDEIERIETGYDCEVVMQTVEGQRLRHKPTEDVHCHDIAHVYLGAESYDEACEKYERIIRELGVEYTEVGQ